MSKVVVTVEDMSGEYSTYEYDGEFNLSLNQGNALIVTEVIGHPVVGLDGKETPPEQKVVAIFHSGCWTMVQVDG
jgi:hypothetical protein